MNMYIKQQINNMMLVTNTFQQSCEMAAKMDDGNISFSEEKILKKIKKASTRFLEELKEISNEK